ncbi:RDD family protein [Luedemannella helvata]|uniref:RDD family protein n=1 Tax=Luedemannella helvata TaxID=349315 RepID=A0ABN2XGH6_9ACTN
MTNVSPGWYKDPADPTTQRYWDGEGWLGDPLPADATPPPGPPPVPAPPPPPEPATPAADPTSAAPTTRGNVSAPAPPGSPSAPASRGAPPAPARPPPGTPPPAGTAGESPWGARRGTAVLTPPPGWPEGYPFPFPRSLRMPPPRMHGLPLASPGARLVARLIDIAAVLGLNVIANGYFVYLYIAEIWPPLSAAMRASLAGQVVDTSTLQSSRASTLQFIIILVGIAVWFAYEVPTVAATGQTFGKRVMRLRVMRMESAQPMGFYRSWRRWSVMALPTLLWVCCVGFFIQFFDNLFVAIDRPLRQAIHDKGALTVVVSDRTAKPAEGGQA